MRPSHLFLPALLLCCLYSVQANGDPLPGRDDGAPYSFYSIDYHWLEIEDIGEQVEGLEDNNFVGPIEIGFVFTYYGREYDQVYIASNGYIGFGPPDEYSLAQNSELPYFLYPNNIVALFWKDLNPQSEFGTGVVFTGHRDGNFVVQYQQYPEIVEDGHSPQNTITMEAVFSPDGNIILQYRTIGDSFDLSQGTIGTENFDGSDGITIRNDGEGEEIDSGTAFLISDHGPGNFLVWNGGANTPSGSAEATALRASGHNVTFLQLSANQQLPQDLGDFEAVFVNLGNYGNDGNGYHQLTRAEGDILAAYAQNGGSVYLEGSDFWTIDQATAAHELFKIRGEANGHPLSAPVTGLDGSFAEGMLFEDYNAQRNNSVDHLTAIDDGKGVFSFLDGEETKIGMVSWIGQSYKSIGASFEFGGLVDGETGTKRELMDKIVSFFRQPFPTLNRPVNLSAVPGNASVTLSWEMPDLRRGARAREIDLEHRIASLIPTNGEKPGANAREEILNLRGELERIRAQRLPLRDDLLGYNVYVQNAMYDFTNSTEYTVIELRNGTSYSFSVSAVYRDPDGESEHSEIVRATPSGLWIPPITQTFEQNTGSLSPTPGEGGWEWGIPDGGAANGQRAWGTRLNSNYPDLADFVLLSPRIAITDTGRTQLSFNTRYNCEAGWDGGRVEYSPDGGNRWEVLIPQGGYPENTIFAFDGAPGFSGNSGGWIPTIIDLSGLGGQEIALRFHFRSDDSQNGPGWFIDDLRLYKPETGSVTIFVKTQEDQIPIPGAEVILDGTLREITSNTGQVQYFDIASGNHACVVNAVGFNLFNGNVTVVTDAMRVREFFLEVYDSRLSFDPESIDQELEAGEASNVAITLANEGGNETEYQVYFDYFVDNNQAILPGPAEQPYQGPGRDEPWELIKTINLTEKTGEEYIIAGEFIRNGTPDTYNILVSAGNFRNGYSHFYLLNRDGDTLRTIELRDQNVMAGWGLRDLAYDGTYVYGSSNNNVYKVNPFDGRIPGGIADFSTPLNVVRGIAWIPGENSYWVGDRDDTWYKYHRSVNGNVSLVYRVSEHGLTGVAGMAWNPSDPDGAYLYVHNQTSENGGATLYRYNPQTGELIRQMETATEEEGFPGGIFTTYLYDTQTWMLGVIIQGPDADILNIYELWPKQNWAKISPLHGVLQSNEETPLRVDFDTEGRINSQLFGNIQITDLRANDRINIPVSLLINGGAGAVFGQVSLDGDGEIQDVDINLNGTIIAPNVDGSYSFQNLLPGRYLLQANMGGYISFVGDSFSIAPNDQIEINVQLNHIRAGFLGGHTSIVYQENSWLRNVEISAISEDNGRYASSTLSNEDGDYFLTLPEGVYTVTPRLAGWRGDPVENIVIRDGEETIQDFTLDDRLAIRSIRVNGHFDNRLILTWDPPGTQGVVNNLRYDDDRIANAVYLHGREDVIAVRFEPENVFDIQSLQFYMFRRNDFNFGGWPDFGYVPIHYRIWLEDPETGLPGEEIWNLFTGNAANRWVTVIPIGLRFLSGPFYVGWHQNLNGNQTTFNAVGLDANMDHPGTTFLRIDGQWSQFDGLPGDNMIRATVLDYFEDIERQEAPRPLRRVDVPRATVADVSSEIEIGRGDSQITSISPDISEPIDAGDLPFRDLPDHYKILRDGEIVDEGQFFGNSWTHFDSTVNEDVEYTFQVIAVYQIGEDVTEIASPEVVGKFNMPPGTPTSVTAVSDGLDFTIRWNIAQRNADGDAICEDYAGCQVFINDELMDVIEAPDREYHGQIAEGAEGWYNIKLVAFDEVPNYSPPAESNLALGSAQVYNFESAIPDVFAVTPGGSWSRTISLVNGPVSAHSGSKVWGTSQISARRYANNANQTITTNNEYLITSATSRMEFYQYMSAEEGHDGGQVLISVDGGEFNLAVPEGGYTDQTVAAFQNRPAFTGEIAAWELISFDLSDYQGHTVKFRWNFKSDNAVNWYAGWFIDDLAIWGGAPPQRAQIYGTVNDQDGQPVNAASVTDGRVSTLSNVQGAFRLTGLVPGNRTISVNIAGYEGDEVNIDLQPRDSVEANFELFRAKLSLNEDTLQFALGANEEYQTTIGLSNETDRPLPYLLSMRNQAPNRDNAGRVLRSTLSRSPLRDQPGDLHFDIDLTSSTGLQRIMGVEFADGNFYVTSGDPAQGLVVAVLDRNGRRITQYRQPQTNKIGWGLRDLAWDGEYLYGSQNDSIYSFTTEGNLQFVQPGAPLTVNRALAYDRTNDAFWCGEYDSPWYLVNREGRVLNSWNEHGLDGVYGFAWFEDDPDGFPLYVANLERDGSTRIYKSDPTEGAIEETEYTFEGTPTGLCVTGSWDANRWILGAIAGFPSQHLYGLELGSRLSWFTADPIEGEVGAGETEDIDLTFTVPDNAQADEIYTANLIVNSLGGMVATLSASMEIVEGFRHFEVPVESDVMADMRIASVTIYDRDLTVGSEIAVVTPDARVGGLIRWIDAPGDFILYAGEEGFAVGDSLEFIIWDAKLNQELRPDVYYTQGEPNFRPESYSEVELTVREEEYHRVVLESGWNLISSFIDPLNHDIPTIFDDILNDNNLVMVKDGNGRFWTIRHNYNGLRPWNSLQGYQVNVNDDDTVMFGGWRVDPSTPIGLSVGWNTIGYLLDHPVEPQVGFEGIISEVLIAKNGHGDFIVPRHDYYGISELNPGEGFKIKVERQVNLVYADAQYRREAPSRQIDPIARSMRNTGSDMSILIIDAPESAIGEGARVVAVTVSSGRVVGMASLTELPTGLVIHGDDTLTVEIDGAIKDEALTIYACNEDELTAYINRDRAALRFSVDGFETISLKASVSQIPTEYELAASFPNPFNSHTTVRFGLPSATPIELNLIDLNGRSVWNYSNSILAAGWHNISVDGTSLSTGIYWLQMKSGPYKATQKLVLLR